MAKQQVIVDGEVMTAIANYLSTRPFREVAPLMQGLNSVKPAPAQDGEQTDSRTQGVHRQTIPEHPVDPRIQKAAPEQEPAADTRDGGFHRQAIPEHPVDPRVQQEPKE